MTEHILYKPEDFNEYEKNQDNALYWMVVKQNLGVCKQCGAGEAELDDYSTCEEYRNRSITDHKALSVRRCRACGKVFTDPELNRRLTKSCMHCGSERTEFYHVKSKPLT